MTKITNQNIYVINLTLGSIFGMCWSLLPGFLSEIIKNFIDMVLVLIVGVITGISMTQILLIFSRYFNYSFIKLCLTSPIIISVSGLIFGMILGLVGKLNTGSEIYRRTNGNFSTDFLSYSLLWIYIFPIAIPCAILNIFIFNLINKKFDGIVSR